MYEESSFIIIYIYHYIINYILFYFDLGSTGRGGGVDIDLIKIWDLFSISIFVFNFYT